MVAIKTIKENPHGLTHSLELYDANADKFMILWSTFNKKFIYMAVHDVA